MGWRAGLERGEGGQTACQGGRGGQDPTRGATSVFQHCSLRELVGRLEDWGRRTGAEGPRQTGWQACTHPPAQQTDLWASGLQLMFTGELRLVAGCGVAPSLLPYQ